jgi:glycosyltransferase involved in cell wall biosynthesis
MKVSIVIPAFNEAGLIGGTLRSVKAAAAALSRRGWETELIVCDNNSTDATAEITRDAGATVVFEPVNQIARARNTGAAAASGDWLIFVDADSQPTAELFEEVAGQIAGGQCLAGGCTVKLESGHPIASLITGVWNSISRTCRYMAGSFVFCDAAAFRRVGGFPEELYAGEEIELSKRLKKLACETGRQIVILRRNPLLTSARKMRLYTRGELARFLFRTILARGKNLNSREACHTWYDGRR